MYCFLYHIKEDKIKVLLNSGPYFTREIEKIGKKYYFDFNDINKFALLQCKTKKARILSLKKGNKYKLYKISSNTELYLYHLTDLEEITVNNINNLVDQCENLRSIIYQKTESLQKQLKDLEKQKDEAIKSLPFIKNLNGSN